MKVKYLPLLLALAVIIGFIAGMQVQEVPLIISPDKNAFNKSSDEWQKAKTLIKRYHPQGYKADSLEYQLLNKLLNELDPYSRFVPFDASEYYAGKLNGTASHWGVKGITSRDTLLVLEVESASPLYLQGVQPGDRLIMSEDSIIWLNYDREEKVLEIPIKELFEIESCFSAVSLNGDELYIKIKQFGPKAYREFMEILENFPQARKKLVIDLRGNPGGDLNQALQIANQFIDQEEKNLLHMRLVDNKEKTFTSSGKNFFKPGNIRVFIDGRTASSAEILTGILQVYADALVVGEESMGKNELMKTFELEDGILHLQTGYYSIIGLEYFGNGRGILPDVEFTLDSLSLHLYSASSKEELLNKYLAFQDDESYNRIKGGQHQWLEQCTPAERLLWLDIMSLHIQKEEFFNLLENYDPYFTLRAK